MVEIITSKETKRVNKKCNWCLENWWNGREYITRICEFHQKYSYERCLKEIKKDKKGLIFFRFCSFLLFLGGIILLVLAIRQIINGSSVEGSFSLFGALANMIIAFCLWKDIEKNFHKWIKESKKEKLEWKKVWIKTQ